MPLPANGPDCNPIDYALDMLGRKVVNKSTTTEGSVLSGVG